MSDQERIAILETNQIRLQKDIQELFAVIREQNDYIKKHMEKEEERWQEISNVMSRWRGFAGGIFLFATALWSIVYGVVNFIGKFKGA